MFNARLCRYDKEGNGYITTAVLKEILRELDETLTNDDLDQMIEGTGKWRKKSIDFVLMLRLFFIAEIDSDGSGTVDFDGNLIFLILEKLRKVSTFLLSLFLLTTEFMEVRCEK